MRLSRRRCLLAGGAALPLLTGCSTGVLRSGDGDARETETDRNERSSSSDPLTLQFGETAVFTNDDAVELEVTPVDARLTEAIVIGGKGGIDQVSAYVPNADDALYLLVTLRLTNAGSAETKVPGGLFFATDGDQVSRAHVDTPGQDYDDLGWVDAGESVEGALVFEVPADAAGGHVEAKFRTLFQSPPVRWELGLADVPRTTYDFDGLEPEESVEFGTDEYRYSFTALDATEAAAYEASNGGTRKPASGEAFVFVEVDAENVGTSPVNLPSPFDMRLLAGDSAVRAETYEDAEARYTGGTVAPGESRAGEVLFAAPDSVSTYALQVEFGNGPVGTWDFE